MQSDSKHATKAQENMRWGTYGKGHTLKTPEYKTLGDLETDHLLNIIKTQYHIPSRYVKAIFNILLDRGIENPWDYLLTESWEGAVFRMKGFDVDD